MVDSIAYKNDDGASLELVFHNSSIQFRSIEKDTMTDITLSKTDVEDIVHELRLWLGKMHE